MRRGLALVGRVLSAAFLAVAVLLILQGLFGLPGQRDFGALSRFGIYQGFDPVELQNGVTPFLLGNFMLLVGELLQLRLRRPVMGVVAGVALVLLLWKSATIPAVPKGHWIFPDASTLEFLIPVSLLVFGFAVIEPIRMLPRLLRRSPRANHHVRADAGGVAGGGREARVVERVMPRGLALVGRVLSVAFLAVAGLFILQGLFGLPGRGASGALLRFGIYKGFDPVKIQYGVTPFLVGNFLLLVGELLRLRPGRPVMGVVAGVAFALLLWKRATIPAVPESHWIFPDAFTLELLIAAPRSSSVSL